MKHLKVLLILSVAFAATLTTLSAQEGVDFVDATSLNIIGKAFETTNPYHRVEVSLYPELNDAERDKVCHSSGLKVMFHTNSTTIYVRTQYQKAVHYGNMTDYSTMGYDLYIKKDGERLFANALSHKNGDGSVPMVLMRDMEPVEKECMLYLPLYCELSKVEIGIDHGSTIEAIDNPFRNSLFFFGSSFTQGVSASRAGMSYPMQFERNTGMYVINLGLGGNSKLQPVFAEILSTADVDAFVIDGFSNPSASIIREILIPFITTIRSHKPHTPLIFVQTIYRERGNFNKKIRQSETEKMEAAREQMAKALEMFDDVYFIDTDLVGTDHITSADGTHPSDLGYWRWANNLEPKVLEILKKYSIE